MEENSTPEKSSPENQPNDVPSSEKEEKSNNYLLWVIFGLIAILIIMAIIMISMSSSNKKQAPAKIESPMMDQKIKNDLDTNEPTSDPYPEEMPSYIPEETDPAPTSTPPPPAEPESCIADKFDDKKYDDGESYKTKDDCEKCTCNDGDWDCEIKDSCIILPTDCTHDGEVFHDGEDRPGMCDQTCECDKGSWDCELNSGSPCCMYDGHLQENGNSFPATDGCNTCTCSNGSVNCTLMLCP